MFVRALLALVLCGAVVSGCKCSNEVTVGGGRDAGGGVVADGGAGTENPDGGDTEPVDAGDGTTTQGVEPGGFNLDGGTMGGLGGEGDGVKVDPNGNIVLNSGEIQLHFAWIANATSGWVSKYDTQTGKEVGRYWSVVPVNGLGTALPLRFDVGNSPSRTAVDLFGDVWVANRAVDIQGSVTKIANDVSDCVDRNNDGVITTSKDVNGDGMIDTAAGAGEFIQPSDFTDPKTYDECVLFSTLVGGTGGGVKARALAISQGGTGTAGEVWVGIHANKTVIKLRATNGEQIPVNAGGAMEIPLPGFASGPYGAAIDGKQRLWVVDTLNARLALVDTVQGVLVNDAISPPVSTGSYGIGIDGKDRVWLAGWTGAHASRYDHGPGVGATPGTWTKFDFAGTTTIQSTRTFGFGRGIAADDKGLIFMSGYNSGGAVAQLISFDGETGAIRPFQTTAGAANFIDATDADTSNSIGVALDADGNPWVNNYSGNAMRVHRDTGEVLKTAKQGGALYTYSDFTGYQLRKFTAPRGTYTHTFTGCGPDTAWKIVTWTADTPPGTQIQVYVKVADSIPELGLMSTPRYGPFTSSPADLESSLVPKKPYLRVEFVLTSNDGMTTPVLKGFNVKWGCGGIQ